MTGSASTGGWPPSPGWPPEVPPPLIPPERPAPPQPPQPPLHPPVPIVYEPAPPVADLADRLLERRIVMVSGHLDTAGATDAAARLMLLDGTGDDPIELVVSCTDGDLTAATALADTVELVGVEVRALASGSVGGAAVLPYAVAARRLAQPHATFRLADPRQAMEGRASDLAHAADQHAELVAHLHRRVAEAAGRSPASVAADFERERLLTAPDAKAYGLVHEIARTRLSAVGDTRR
jgi:ATP-dependent Clp protease protease subunit